MEVRDLHQVVETTPASGLDHRLRLLLATGSILSSAQSLDGIAQVALDSGLAVSEAEYGAFLYNRPGDKQGSGELRKVCGSDPNWFVGLPLPTDPSAFVIRSGDIAVDGRHSREQPFRDGAASRVRSYLAVPLRNRDHQRLGHLLYGHSSPNVFRPEAESLVAGVATHASAALESLSLRQQLSHEVVSADAARAEQRTTERRLQQALDAGQLGTWIWDAASGLIDFDDRGAELFEVEPNVPTSRQQLWQEKVLEDDRSESPEDFQALMNNGQKYAAEYRITLADGTLRWIAASGIPAVDESSGRVVGMTGTVQDISLRKTQEESLRQSEKLAATGRLAATIAHEINNPLEAVTNLIYLAKTDPSTPQPIEKLLETADSELARVSQIAQQTLGFYRDTTNPVTIDLNELLGGVVDLFGRKLAVKRVQVTLDLEPGLSLVGLQGEIRQVVSNLLVNAIDASPQGGSSIRIRGRYRRCNGRNGISMLITDQGSGIPAHVRSRLFTPFVTTKQSRGTGLGLWVTRGMVEKHGGTVRFRTRTETPAGTVFRLYFPQRSENQAFSSPSSAVLQ